LSKTLFILEEFENAGFWFCVYGKKNWKQLCTSDIHVINPNPEAFLPPVIVMFSNFSGVVRTENIEISSA